jgi:hypothetical protein
MCSFGKCKWCTLSLNAPGGGGFPGGGGAHRGRRRSLGQGRCGCCSGQEAKAQVPEEEAEALEVDVSLGEGGEPVGGGGPRSVTIIRNIKNMIPPGGEKV